jgi:carbon monoxide dehydrogenase subunit G
MKRVERQATIAAPPDEVFAYLSDLEKLSEWQAGVVSAQPTSDGPMGVGATALVTREIMGKRVEAPLTVTEYDPPRRLAIGSEVSGVKAHGTLDFSPADEGRATDLTFAMEIRGSGFSGFIEGMIASAASGDIDSSLEQLKQRFSGD